MPRAPSNETVEEKKERYLQAGYNIAKSRKQNKNDDGTLKVTEDDLWYQANQYAEKQMERYYKGEEATRQVHARMTVEDEEYRSQRLKTYYDDYEWNTSNDIASLEHLLDLEVNIRQINRELNEGDKSTVEKDKLRKNLTDSIRERRQLEQSLGIDRVAREKKSTSGDPMSEWTKILEEAREKKRQQRDEFLTLIEDIKTEAELRDRIKVGLLLKFDVIDPLLSAHRKVLGLSPEVDKA